MRLQLFHRFAALTRTAYRRFMWINSAPSVVDSRYRILTICGREYAIVDSCLL